MPRLNLPDVVDRYLAGETIKRIADSLGVSRSAVTHRIKEAGIPLRSQSDIQLQIAAARSPAERKRIASAAHAAIRGSSQSDEHRCKIAAFREANALGVTPTESMLADWLRARGMVVTPQKAIGRYNVDVAVDAPAIAVEIFGGGWHAAGRHAARFRERCDYILDRGWALVIVWVDGRRFPLRSDVSEYLVALAQRRGVDKSKWCQEQVIRGTGDVLVSGHDPNTGAAVSSCDPAKRARGNDGRFPQETVWMGWRSLNI